MVDDEQARDEIWNSCRNDQDLGACRSICNNEFEIMPEEWTEKACLWQNAWRSGNSSKWYWCEDGNLDWCEFVCIDAANGNDRYWDEWVTGACSAIAYTDDEGTDEDAAEVSLASKSEAVENDSYNAGYYLAGASILGATAVAFIILKKKGEKVASEEPLLASDDAIKATM